MKLPKRIKDLLVQKQDFIDSQRGRMEASVIKLQSQLLSNIISDVIPELDVKDGLIQNTAKNYRLISTLDKTYKVFQTTASGVILGQITLTTSKIVKLSTEYFNTILFKEGIPLTNVLIERFDNVVAKASKLIDYKIGLTGDKVFKGGWLDSFFKSNTVGLELKEMTSKAVTSNMDMKDFVKLLKEKVTGSADYKGSLEKQFDAYGYDLYQQYDSAYNLSLGNEFGFTYFIYQGGLILDSRDFCAAHNNKVWSKEEMATWPQWVPADGEYPAGYEIKAKDLYSVPSYITSKPGYDPGLDRGGWKCRHALGWIADELAFRLRPELKRKINLFI